MHGDPSYLDIFDVRFFFLESPAAAAAMTLTDNPDQEHCSNTPTPRRLDAAADDVDGSCRKEVKAGKAAVRPQRQKAYHAPPPPHA